MSFNSNHAPPPLLLIAWRRPHALRQVINAIRPVAPKRLYVACDGPNPERPGEAEKVAATRMVIEKEIDWPCLIERLYSDENQGCRLGMSRAITWFFEQVEEGIILEDDCVPHPNFFPYCSELLERYRHDTRVWNISGNNFQNGHWRGDGSYYFSHYKHCWGWATWRRCWSKYDKDLSLWPTLRDSGLLKTIFSDPVERQFWYSIWEKLLHEGEPDSCGYRWGFTCFMNGGLSITPNSNLVSNIGFDQDSTHTFWNTSDSNSNAGFVMKATSVASGLDFPLRHPPFIVRDFDADCYDFLHVIGGSINTSEINHFKRLYRKIHRKIRIALNFFTASHLEK